MQQAASDTLASATNGATAPYGNGATRPSRMPLTVIMYGFLTRSSTWARALSTTTQRATCSATPRQESRSPRGWCQERLHHQASIDTADRGRMWARKLQ